MTEVVVAVADSEAEADEAAVSEAQAAEDSEEAQAAADLEEAQAAEDLEAQVAVVVDEAADSEAADDTRYKIHCLKLNSISP